MKKFLKIRNIIVTIIAIIAIVVICFIRRSDVTSSKTWKYLDNICQKDSYILTTKNVVINSIKDIDNEENSANEITWGIDKKNRIGFMFTRQVNNDYHLMILIENKKSADCEAYIINESKELEDKGYLEDKYIHFQNFGGNIDRMDGISNMMDNIFTLKSYFRGYDFVDSKFKYYERFDNTKYYIENDNLFKMKETDVGDSYDLNVEYESLNKESIVKKYTGKDFNEFTFTEKSYDDESE